MKKSLVFNESKLYICLVYILNIHRSQNGKLVSMSKDNDSSESSSIRLTMSTKIKLKNLALTKGESYENIILRLLDKTKEK
ncbi:hypothetical protein MBCUT_20870 [Methanobrevibacter cuticularis]|uniref:Uncharacterized protein n=1 Tax=Methanobrevibacter cuticularis TaxID=47311 RepID=A0A166CHJ2_9EURY|nr:hypothetical protein MBCUT_20870 [Methanobrevibacter cuticularis]